MRILLFIGTLRTGGAEAQTVRLTEGLVRLGFDVELLTLFPGGQFWDQMSNAAEVQPRALYPSPAKSRAGRMLQILDAPRILRRQLRAIRPDVFLSSLYLSNFIALRAWRREKACPLIWSIRCSTIPPTLPRSLYFRASRWGVHKVPAVIYNSHAGLEHHLANGFPEAGARVIVNGIASDRFYPDALRGGQWREKVGPHWEDGPLVGMAARLVEMKDHTTFLRAMAKVSQHRPEARFVCLGGGGSPAYERQLQATAESLGIGDRVFWAGEERDMLGALNALDLLVSSSSTCEAFSNSIGEAMACGCPCVATDVGDARRILGETGVVVPPRDPEALASAVCQLLDQPEEARQRRQEEARRRIEECFTVDAMVHRTVELLTEQVAAWTSAKEEKARGGFFSSKDEIVGERAEP